jgi:isoquinoline 1-oxidoreductase subunit beta
MKTAIDRRDFIKLTSLTGSGLMLGFMLGCNNNSTSADCEALQPNAYLKVDKNGQITIFVARQEMGQGVNTSLPMIVAEEMDADWKNIEVKIAAFGTMKKGDHDTGGSQSVMGDYQTLRKAGAIAKSMLVAAAAKQWNIGAEKCVADNGAIVNTINSSRLNYGDIVCDAGKLPVPKDVMLKSPKDFKLIGKANPKSNLNNILTGKAKYGIDGKLPDMVYATVERCPVLGGKIKSLDDSACKQVTGFIKTVSFEGTGMPMHIHAGVAVIATNTWSAMQARKALKVQWDEGEKNKESTDALFKTFEEKSKQKPAIEVYKKGDISSVHAPSNNSIESAYAQPFLAHAAMEPINIIAQVKKDSCELWGGSQMPDWAAETLSSELGLKKEQIKINLTLMGGAFGRRLFHDYMIEAAKIAKQIDKPVKLIWDRTDDVRNDTFRPANYHRMKASWDATGALQTWQHHVLGTPVSTMTEGPDTKNAPEMEGGASFNLWYDVPNMYSGYTGVEMNLNRGWLRAVDVCVNVFPVECFIDEIAVKQKKDPLAYRLSLLDGKPIYENKEKNFKQDRQRIANVLKLAAEKIGYHNLRQKNHFIGVATHHFTFANAYAAHAIEIEMISPKKFRIIKIVGAVDCGIVVNPDGMMNQMEGGCAFALSQVLMGEITVKDSRVEQDGYFTYKVLRYNEMPPIEIYSIPSTEEPGGIGEIGLPTVAPALCNALAAAGHRPRHLPIKNDGFEWV